MKSKLLGFGSFFCGINFFVMWCIAMVIHTTRFGREYEAFAIPAILMGIIPIFAFIAIDIIHITKNPAFSRKEKVKWIIIVYGFHAIAFPVYWKKYQRQDHQTNCKLDKEVESADDAD